MAEISIVLLDLHQIISNNLFLSNLYKARLNTFSFMFKKDCSVIKNPGSAFCDGINLLMSFGKMKLMKNYKIVDSTRNLIKCSNKITEELFKTNIWIFNFYLDRSWMTKCPSPAESRLLSLHCHGKGNWKIKMMCNFW